MNATEIQEYLDKAKRHFNLHSITLEILSNSKNGRAYSDGRIVIGAKHKACVKAVLTHELAHYLTYREGLSSISRHNEGFRNSLIKVIQYFYNGISEYPWEMEYINNRKWAIRNGYTGKNLEH